MLSQVVYFTATFPYVLLVAITAYGLTLPGALDGVKELFVPKAWTGPKTITDPQVWRKAAEQMFYSLSVSFVEKKTEYNYLHLPGLLGRSGHVWQLQQVRPQGAHHCGHHLDLGHPHHRHHQATSFPSSSS